MRSVVRHKKHAKCSSKFFMGFLYESTREIDDLSMLDRMHIILAGMRSDSVEKQKKEGLSDT